MKDVTPPPPPEPDAGDPADSPDTGQKPEPSVADATSAAEQSEDAEELGTQEVLAMVLEAIETAQDGETLRHIVEDDYPQDIGDMSEEDREKVMDAYRAKRDLLEPTDKVPAGGKSEVEPEHRGVPAGDYQKLEGIIAELAKAHDANEIDATVARHNSFVSSLPQSMADQANKAVADARARVKGKRR